MKYFNFCIVTLLFLFSNTVFAGLYVSGSVLYEYNGTPFKIRGINHAHAWYADKLETALQGISSTGANTVRIVLSNGHRWNKTSAEEVGNIIRLAKSYNLIAVLEVHDTTGYGEESSAADLNSAADYWIEIKEKLIGEENYVIINLGNEPFGNGIISSDWVKAHKDAINRLRSEGMNHVIMVDAPNWGQDWQNIMLDNATSILDSDPLHNIIFSVHMYEVYGDYSTVNNYISSFINKGISLVVGEFAATHKGSNVDESAIMERTETLSLGYIGWSWSGNDDSTADLDIVNNWNNDSYTKWGNTLINGENGIKSTSQIATVFTCKDDCSGESTQYPICSSSSLDPDGDGWGWENEQSCIVQDSNETAPNGYAYCSSESSDPDGDGWGWENNESCVVKGSNADD
ncbi:cellulase family glycosylhydrolase [Vibrio sp. Vb2880]|uniref:cellulase family glycosylhydrolase n=1 Tax=Vibrio sp. Vb2880 TaxID=2816076 RepID=UPI001A8CD318|nr:cellulase family glycosylhydrolase [Vibrio sp. Vb2880]MBO0212884.1 cellulase family glycosylhydrolase [Vibrio sp. Vb2880]